MERIEDEFDDMINCSEDPSSDATTQAEEEDSEALVSEGSNTTISCQSRASPK